MWCSAQSLGWKELHKKYNIMMMMRQAKKECWNDDDDYFRGHNQKVQI